MNEFDFEAPEPEEGGGREAEASQTEETSFKEYEAPNGDKWRIERGADLLTDFEIEAPELAKWHLALCGQEPAWTILCRIYGNAPLYGVEDPDELRAWTIAELAEKRAVEPREIDGYLHGARSYWKRWQMDSEAGAASAPKLKPPPDDDTAAELLLANGFAQVESVEERGYIATRIQELKPYLEADNLRSAARSLIQQEVSIFFILDPTVHDIRNGIKGRKPSDKEQKQLMDALKDRREAQSALEASMKSLGLTDGKGAGITKKLSFNDSLAALIEGYQKYYSENDRSLIDGMFTAAEVELLTTPTELRPAQYRPDLIVSMEDAKKHLWESDWSPTPMSRRACRKLRAGFARGLAEARSEEGEVTGDEIADEENLDAAPAGTSAAVPFEATTQITNPVPLPRASRAEDPAALIT